MAVKKLHFKASLGKRSENTFKIKIGKISSLSKKFRRKLVAENFRFSPAMNLKRDFRRTIFASIGLGEVSLPAQFSWPRPSWRSLRSWCFRSSPPGRGSTSRPPPRSSSRPTRWACDGARRWRCSRCRPERRQRWFADQGSRVRGLALHVQRYAFLLWLSP